MDVLPALASMTAKTKRPAIKRHTSVDSSGSESSLTDRRFPGLWLQGRKKGSSGDKGLQHQPSMEGRKDSNGLRSLNSVVDVRDVCCRGRIRKPKSIMCVDSLHASYSYHAQMLGKRDQRPSVTFTNETASSDTVPHTPVANESGSDGSLAEQPDLAASFRKLDVDLSRASMRTRHAYQTASTFVIGKQLSSQPAVARSLRNRRTGSWAGPVAGLGTPASVTVRGGCCVALSH